MSRWFVADDNETHCRGCFKTWRPGDEGHCCAERYHPDFDAKRIELGDRRYVEWCLEGSYSAQGQAQWWNKARSFLGGKTPNEAWNEHREAVVHLAEGLFR